jgi:hypothetical protein
MEVDVIPSLQWSLNGASSTTTNATPHLLSGSTIVELGIRHCSYECLDLSWVDVIPSLQRHLSGAYCKALDAISEEDLFGFKLTKNARLRTPLTYELEAGHGLLHSAELTDEYTSRWEKERTSRARRASQARANRYGLIDEVVNVFF